MIAEMEQFRIITENETSAASSAKRITERNNTSFILEFKFQLAAAKQPNRAIIAIKKPQDSVKSAITVRLWRWGAKHWGKADFIGAIFFSFCMDTDPCCFGGGGGIRLPLSFPFRFGSEGGGRAQGGHGISAVRERASSSAASPTVTTTGTR